MSCFFTTEISRDAEKKCRVKSYTTLRRVIRAFISRKKSSQLRLKNVQVDKVEEEEWDAETARTTWKS